MINYFVFNEETGAAYIDGSAVMDENTVTTAHYKDLGPWMVAILELAQIFLNKKDV